MTMIFPFYNTKVLIKSLQIRKVNLEEVHNLEDSVKHGLVYNINV